MKLALNSVKKLHQRALEDPIRYFVPTRPQRDFINDPSKIKMLLGGNQIGKSIATCFLLVAHCLGNAARQVIRDDPQI